MHYQPLLLAALAALTNAAATPSQLAASYGTVSADLAVLSNAIAQTGPSMTSLASYNKALSDIERFQVAVGDTKPHPCFPVMITKVTTKEQAEEYVDKTEETITDVFKGYLGGENGAQICVATQYLSAVGDYIRG